MERKLAIILAADVVGYSAMMEADEAGTFSKLKARRRELLEPEIARHHGRIFKLMGDGLLAEFGSVVDAVECAVALQRGLAERNGTLPADQRIELRIGINLGEVIVEGDDRYGEGVNIASRLEQLAEPGGVCVSGKVAQEVARKLAFAFEPMGEQRLKNIAEPVQAFKISFGTATSASRAAISRASKGKAPLFIGSAVVALAAAAAIYGWITFRGMALPPAPDTPSIAVLAFENLSDDPQQTYFADGIAEDLMTDLSRIPGLFVTARNSSFAYRGKATDIRQIARELGVRHVLEGSVRRAGDQIRINIQLIDGATGDHQWAERYDGRQTDIFALQDQVTKAVVQALAPQLSPAEQKTVLGEHETNLPEAYEAFLKGWEHFGKNNAEDFKLAIPQFERAVALDPDYGRASAALGIIYVRSLEERWPGALGITADEALRKARDLLKASMVRPTSTTHRLAGGLAQYFGWFDQAEKDFRSAIALEPNDSWSYADLSQSYARSGKFDEASQALDTAMRIDPHYPSLFEFYRGMIAFARGDDAEAAPHFGSAAKADLGDGWIRLYSAVALANNGNLDTAGVELEAFNKKRVELGGIPLFMKEIAGNDNDGFWKTLPQRERLVVGLRKLNVPYSILDERFKELRLSGEEIDRLFVGHTLHGRTLENGKEHGAIISVDGAVQAYGDWTAGTGAFEVRDNRVCFVFSATGYEFCGEVYRNPGGSRTSENEYVLFTNWPTAFSQVK